jgi:hypothetical protein
VRVVAQLGIADRQEHQLSDVGEYEVVTVGWGTRDRLHRDRAARAGAGLDEKLLLEDSRQMVSDETGKDIGGAAGSKRVDHADRTRRPFVGRRCGGKRHGARGEGSAKPFHGFISEGSIAPRV